MDWFDREEAKLEDELASGLITQKEFYEYLRDLRRELEQEAEDRAKEAYNDTMGYF